MVKTQMYQAYSAASQTIGKTRQVVMLYDGAIRNVKQAKEAIVDGRIEDRYRLLARTSEIMMGLQSSIDFEAGGEVAKVLHDFYSSIITRLSVIQRRNDATIAEEVIQELKNMREVWDSIDKSEHAAAAYKKEEPNPLAGIPPVRVTISA